jgi:SAM-dependent methyltransferase
MTTAAAASKAEAWQRVLNDILGNQAAWIADIGLKAGLFQAVRESGAGVTAEALASSLGFDPHLTAVWCRGAYAFELLDWAPGSGYRLDADLAVILLDPADPQFLGGRLQFYTALYEDFRAFPRLLRDGGTWPRSEHDPWLIAALANLSKPDVAMLIGHAIPQTRAATALAAGGRLLEIGSGLGYHIVEYARHFPAAWLVGIEYDPASAALARAAVREAGPEVARRVEIREGDANALNDTDAYDLVVMNITLHETGDESAWPNVLRRSHRALRPGGSVLVSELPYPDDVTAYRAGPIQRMLAGVQLHEAVVGCGAITQSGLARLLEDAGFANVRVVDQPMPTRHVMVGDR